MNPTWLSTVGPDVLRSPAVRAAVPAPEAPDSNAMAVALGRILRPSAAVRWNGWLAKDYTPDRIETVLRAALWGDHVGQWELFALMEDTWPRLGKALAELKRSVQQRDWHVEPWDEEDMPATPEAEARARVVSHGIWTMAPRPDEGGNGFEQTVFDLLDAWAKGVSVLEIEWETRPAGVDRTPMILPKATHWVHPSFYAWDSAGVLRLRRNADRRQGAIGSTNDFEPFPENKFLLGICRSRSGSALGGALLRPLAWWWCAANFSAAWLLNLSQIFGLPIRWANYAPGSSDALVDQICRMLENMGSAAWAAFPAGTQIELKEPSKSGGDWPQDSLLDRADRQADLLVLGQTLTSTEGQSGTNGTAFGFSNIPRPGAGGGGGYPGTSTIGIGGDGGWPGGGGGGGAGSKNGTTSGSGGNGASGVVVIKTFF